MNINFIHSQDDLEITVKGDAKKAEVIAILTYLENFQKPTRLLVYDDEKMIPLASSDILYFETKEKKAFAMTEKASYQTKLKLYELEGLLGFAQISKSIVVNLEKIDYVAPEFSGNFYLYLKNVKEPLILSRKFSKALLDILRGGTLC